jgi:hypothetical protein
MCVHISFKRKVTDLTFADPPIVLGQGALGEVVVGTLQVYVDSMMPGQRYTDTYWPHYFSGNNTRQVAVKRVPGLYQDQMLYDQKQLSEEMNLLMTVDHP